jgi:TonB family protein
MIHTLTRRLCPRMGGPLALAAVFLSSAGLQVLHAQAPAERCVPARVAALDAADGSLRIAITGDTALLRAHSETGVFVVKADTGSTRLWADHVLSLPPPAPGDAGGALGVELRFGPLPSTFTATRDVQGRVVWLLSNTAWSGKLTFDLSAYAAVTEALEKPDSLSTGRLCGGSLPWRGEVEGEGGGTSPLLKPGTLRPHYPPELREKHVEGSVLIGVLVDTLGRPDTRSVELLSVSHLAFIAAVLQALEDAEFTPGRIEERPVRQWVIIPIDFRIGR